MKALRVILSIFGLLVISWPWTVRAAPLEEIRRILRESALHSPAESALAALAQENLDQGLVRIDPYARLFRPGEYRSPASAQEGWTGIGAELIPGRDGVSLSVFRGGAAGKAGVPDRSRLLEIDGVRATGLTAEEVARRLRGEEGTSVRLKVLPPGGSALNFTVRRVAFRPLDVEPVPPRGERVVRIRDFIAGLTRPALLATLEFLERSPSPSGGGVLILDLRDCGGGDLYEAFDMAGLFLKPGTLLGTIRTTGGEPREVRSPAGDKLAMPLALLVGPDTASAAEVFAGALQGNGRARLVGRSTFGKCASQTDARLSDGSVLRYTNMDILLPGGASCTGSGLNPDVEVGDAEFGDLPGLTARVKTLFGLR